MLKSRHAIPPAERVASPADSPGLLPNLGIACFRLGKVSEGSGYFDQFLERFPTEHRTRLFYAQALEASQEYGKALEQYSRLKQLQPAHPQRALIDQRIAALSQIIENGPKKSR